MSEWLKLMLEEIARKTREAREAREEHERRAASSNEGRDTSDGQAEGK